MFHRATNPMALRDFRTSLHGALILPDDDGYDSARRVWNGMIGGSISNPAFCTLMFLKEEIGGHFVR
jgi:hypothetical protein